MEIKDGNIVLTIKGDSQLAKLASAYLEPYAPAIRASLSSWQKSILEHEMQPLDERLAKSLRPTRSLLSVLNVLCPEREPVPDEKPDYTSGYSPRLSGYEFPPIPRSRGR